MNLDHYRDLLLAKETELLDGLAKAKEEAKEINQPDVEDPMDVAVRTEQVESLLVDGGTQDFETLEQVRDALKRIEDGTYGLCLVCGRPIEEKRLQAVPWAAYDLQHQDQFDRERNRPMGGSTL